MFPLLNLKKNKRKIQGKKQTNKKKPTKRKQKKGKINTTNEINVGGKIPQKTMPDRRGTFSIAKQNKLQEFVVLA